MPTDQFPLEDYYARLGISAGEGPTLARLEEIQRAQLCTIPYENFDVLLGRGVNLSPDHLYPKLLNSARGRYCFELNGLFFAALLAEGFKARRLLGRVHLVGDPTGRGHQISLVTIDGKDWIADTGNGAICSRVPLPLETDTVTLSDGTPFRLVDHALGYMLQVQQGGQWRDVYSFDLMPVLDADIDYGNHFTSTHPSSFFLHNRIAVLGHSDGQTIIFNDTCTVIRGGTSTSEAIPDDETYLDLLRDRVGIDLDISSADLGPMPVSSST